jgi:hypothetical protein
MPLPAPSARTAIHQRSIQLDGFEREDGLWDIEGHLTDVKSYAFKNEFRGTVKPGKFIHDMWLRITLDDDLLIHGVEVRIDDSPFKVCPNITKNYEQLIGVKIGIGWRRALAKKVGGTLGCTHLTELLGPLATVAIQTIMPLVMKRAKEAAISAGEYSKQPPKALQQSKAPGLINSCHAWASDGEYIKKNAPDFYTGE